MKSQSGNCDGLVNAKPMTISQAQEFLTFLGQNEAALEKVIKTEEAERRRMLGQVYSFILSWRYEREKGDTAVNKGQVQKSDSVSNSAVAIPRGTYLTIAQVAEICGVKKGTVSAWLKKGLLKSLYIPGLGQIVEEKDLERYLAESQNRP